ncbi:MAG: hypothetical protein ACKPCN_13330 [Dolichospermum sp.]
MQLIEQTLKNANVNISLDELLILNSALNEVCYGLDEFEFETRMGASHEEVAELLKKIGTIIDNFESHANS